MSEPTLYVLIGEARHGVAAAAPHIARALGVMRVLDARTSALHEITAQREPALLVMEPLSPYYWSMPDHAVLLTVRNPAALDALMRGLADRRIAA